MQTTYPTGMPIAQIGQIADLRMSRNIESYAALETIPFGYAVAMSNDPDKPNTVRLPRRTVAVITLSANLIASNVVNGKVGGAAITAVTYASSHDATMDALVAAIEALATVKRAQLGDEDGDNRVILVEVTDTAAVLADWAVTLGSSQATVTITYSAASERIVGVSVFTHTIPQNLSGVASYTVGDAVNVMTKGAIWVPTVDVPNLVPLVNVGAEELNAEQPPLIVIGGDDSGKFSGYPAAGGLTTRVLANSRYRTIVDNGDDTGAAMLILNLPGFAL